MSGQLRVFGVFVLAFLIGGAQYLSRPSTAVHAIESGSIGHSGGYSYSIALPEVPRSGFSEMLSDSAAQPSQSMTEVWEDGGRLEFGHALHEDIRLLGARRFSHWGSTLYFSSTDNSDPRTNGRTYVVQLTETRTPLALEILRGAQLLFAVLVILMLPRSWTSALIRRALQVTAIATLGLTILFFAGIPRTLELSREKIQVAAGYEYKIALPTEPLRYFELRSDTNDEPIRSSLAVFEDGRSLGPPHVALQSIVDSGSGRFAHWGDSLYFSASDNSDPRTNGRRYHVVARAFPIAPLLGFSVGLLAFFGLIRATLDGLGGRFAFLLIVLSGASYGVVVANGVLLWVAIGIALGCGCTVLVWAVSPRGVTPSLSNRPSSTLAAGIGSLALALVMLELLLMWAPRMPFAMGAKEVEAMLVREGVPVPEGLAQAVASRAGVVIFPQEWKREVLSVDGAASAFRWHGAIHAQDASGYRRTTPFPPRDRDRYRIIVLGDSYTFGYGVEEPFTYPRLLEQFLSSGNDVEVLNLGVNGSQSEDVARILRREYARLAPDLVIYGVCLNDFLPSGGRSLMGSPSRLLSALLDRTRAAPAIAAALPRLRVMLGLSTGFADEILENIGEGDERFLRNAVEMQRLVQDAGGAPIVGMVLQNFPARGSANELLAQRADNLLTQAGFTVFPSKPFIERFHGEQFVVSPWELHPDERANALFAKRLADGVREQSNFREFRNGRP
ncbi:MAG: SGNH/GDSL hydrolase family protein [Deltaproteobacteria bacterium]|nr:SGNH/GDSL hydrolase family protein [Deltaproteobacteria bacterium]